MEQSFDIKFIILLKFFSMKYHEEHHSYRKFINDFSHTSYSSLNIYGEIISYIRIRFK